MCDPGNAECRWLTKYQCSRNYIATVRVQVILLLLLSHCSVATVGFTVEWVIPPTAGLWLAVGTHLVS